MAARPNDLDMRALLPPKAERERMYADWLAEDIGRGDITTDFLIPADAEARFTMNTRHDIVVCGVDLALEIMRFHEPGCRTEALTPGRHAGGGGRHARPRRRAGPGDADGRAHRAQPVPAAHRDRHPHRRIRPAGRGDRGDADRHAEDHPGLPRAVEVCVLRRRGAQPPHPARRRAAGQGQPHRGVRLDRRGDGAGARALTPSLTKIEVECDTLDQVREAADARADVILLDNMDAATMREAVGIVGRALRGRGLRRHHARDHPREGGERGRLHLGRADDAVGARRRYRPRRHHLDLSAWRAARSSSSSGRAAPARTR